jgi:hypothetical protein
MSALFAGALWLFGRGYGQEILVIISAFLTLGVVTVVGDIALRVVGLPKGKRRSIIGWVSVLCSAAVAMAGKHFS